MEAYQWKAVIKVLVLTLTTSSLTVTMTSVAVSQPELRRFYAEDYQEARTKFLNEVKTRSGVVTSFRNPVPGPDGQALYTDVARFGHLNPESVLVISSGTHGIEGFAGSAIQVGLLQEKAQELFSPRIHSSDFSLILIHAVNPYGFAHLRRFNEDNVDVNRNFRAHTTPAPRNEGYDRLQDVIVPTSISMWGDFWARMRLYWYRLWNGSKALQTAVSAGQYSDPDGLFYGGDTDTWSKQTMEVIMRRYVAGATHVIVVDIHTGLGPFANAEVITNEPKKSSGYRRAVKLWGDLVRTTHVEESYSVHISGAMKLAIPRLLPGAEVTAVSLEFGTYHGADVFWALREENWLQHHGGEAHSDQRRIKTALRRMFYPSDDEWKRRVWYQGREVINQALAGIR